MWSCKFSRYFFSPPLMIHLAEETPLSFYLVREAGGLFNEIRLVLALSRQTLSNRVGYQLAACSRPMFPLHQL
jgi:hypothetical protein